MVSNSQRQVLLFSPDATPSGLVEMLDDNGWNVVHVSNATQAKQKLQLTAFHVAVLELSSLPSSETALSLEALLSIDPAVNWVLVLPEILATDSFPPPELESLISHYCFDYHHRPVRPDLFLAILGHAHGMAEIALHPCVINARDYSHFGIIGNSEPMQSLYRQITKVCCRDDPVLISGETGTGKELVANAIHYHSSRAESQLVVINCGSLADSLVQAELFGYEKGAFTGAYKRKIGRIEASSGGTLFLDEVGDLPMSQQANLLRFLQEKTIVRVGGHEEIPVDIRVIAATNVELKQAVTEGRFREDLFYRLNVLHLTVPPLRERGDDIELLCRYFLQQDSRVEKRVKGLSAEALQVIRQHSWKGNVRELANIIKHAQIMSESNQIIPADLDLEKRRKPRSVNTLEQTREDADRSAIQGGLRQCQNNVSQTADLLGISRVTLHRLINKYQLKIE